MFAVVLLAFFAILTGGHLYISYRTFQVIEVFFPPVRFWMIAGVFLFMQIMMMLGFASSQLPVSSEIKHAVGTVGTYWMGIFVYLLLFTVLTDLFALFCCVFRLTFANHAMFRGILSLTAVALALGISLYGIHHAKQIKHVTYDILLEDKADLSDLHIVLISDVHLGAVGSEKRSEKIIEEINRLEPDVVCIAGDFFDTDFASIRNPEQAVQTWKKIDATYGVYACLGNHDAGETFDAMQAFMEQCNIRVLNEEALIIDGRFVLAGRLDASPIGGFTGLQRKEEFKLPEGTEDAMPVIVMDHNPANITEYSSEVDLILCGHTHKGQLFPANLITGWMYAVDYGYYREEENSPQVIVTSGVGAWGMPMRVGTDCEIVNINFTFQ